MILLAPMEGLLDFVLRDILTRVGGIDRCVSEFIRVTGTLLPDRVFTRIVPELDHGGRTPAGVPVRAQLMGSDPVCVAENAAKLAALGPAGIDLNFGCPAKGVNRHRGGAVLLDEPELIAQIVAAVRRAVPRHMPVSAKMRLGYNDSVWNVEDAARCRSISGCAALMLGRGIVADPGLALAIRRRGPAAAPRSDERELSWQALLPLVFDFWQIVGVHIAPHHRAGRLKQWLNFLRRRYPEAQAAYATARTINDPALVERQLFAHLLADVPRGMRLAA